jgi:N-methylhydantoinase A
MDSNEAAAGILKIINNNMRNAISLISIEKGHDPRDFTMVAYGGAGPMHAGLLAKDLGIPKIIVPMYPGIHSALGMIASDLKHHYVKSIITPTKKINYADINSALEDLDSKGLDILVSEGIDRDDVVIEHSFDMRYIGQAYIPVSISFTSKKMDKSTLDNIEKEFHKKHHELYKHAAEDEPTEIVNIRATAVGKVAKPIIKAELPKKEPSVTERKIFFEDQNAFVKCPTYLRHELPPEFSIKGPSVIYHYDATTLIYSHQTAKTDIYGNIIIDNDRIKN